MSFQRDSLMLVRAKISKYPYVVFNAKTGKIYKGVIFTPKNLICSGDIVCTTIKDYEQLCEMKEGKKIEIISAADGYESCDFNKILSIANV